MKKFVIAFVSVASTVALARRGNGVEDNNRTITCVDSDSQAVIAQLTQGQFTSFDGPDYSLVVKAAGDDIGQMVLTDKASGDSVQATRSEEILDVQLTTDEAPNSPSVARSATRRGVASVNLVNNASGESAQVVPQSRRGQG